MATSADLLRAQKRGCTIVNHHGEVVEHNPGYKNDRRPWTLPGRNDASWAAIECNVATPTQLRALEAAAETTPEPVATPEPVKADPRVTPEVIEALAWLRNGWDGDNSERAIKALDTLDNAGIFAAIDEATGYDVDPAPERVSKCDCTPTWVGHMPGCPGDPAEWGDMAYTTVTQ